jgi:hypothetical protein
VAELGSASMGLTFFRLADPTSGCATTATYAVHFFQVNFELHLYNVENERQTGETTGN